MSLWPNLRKRTMTFRLRLGEFWWYAALLFCVQRFGDLLNLYIGLWLVPKFVPDADLGALLPLLQIALFLAMPLNLMLTPVSKYLNTFMAKGETGKAKALLIDACSLSLLIAGIMAIYTLAIAPFIQVRLRITSMGVVVMLCGLAFLNGVRPVLSLSTQALKKFDNMIFSSIAAVLMRLLLMCLLAAPFGLAGFMGANFGADFTALLVTSSGLVFLLRHSTPRESYRGHWREMFAFSLPLITLTLTAAFCSTVDPFVIRHRLPTEESTAFYFLSRFAEIPGYMGGTLSLLLFPLVSERFEKRLSSRHLLWQSVLATLLLGGLMILALGLAGGWLLRLRDSWAVAAKYTVLLCPLAATSLLSVAMSIFITYETACRRFALVWCCVVINTIKPIVLYALTGWDFFLPYLPSAWWEAVDRIHACRLGFVIGLMLGTQILLLLAACLVILARHRKKRAE